MDWLESIRKSIDYIEAHLLTLQDAQEVAEEVFLSTFYLQKGFKVMTGYSMAEYIRNRRRWTSSRIRKGLWTWRLSMVMTRRKAFQELFPDFMGRRLCRRG